jgi:hypothetical protein
MTVVWCCRCGPGQCGCTPRRSHGIVKLDSEMFCQGLRRRRRGGGRRATVERPAGRPDRRPGAGPVPVTAGASQADGGGSGKNRRRRRRVGPPVTGRVTNLKYAGGSPAERGAGDRPSHGAEPVGGPGSITGVF